MGSCNAVDELNSDDIREQSPPRKQAEEKVKADDQASVPPIGEIPNTQGPSTSPNTSCPSSPSARMSPQKTGVDGTATDKFGGTLQATASFSLHAQRSSIRPALLRCSENGGLALQLGAGSGNGVLTGSFNLKGDVLLEGVCDGNEQTLKGQLKDGGIKGACITNHGSQDFNLLYEDGLWDSSPIMLTMNGDNEVVGIGRTEYGWATLCGVRTGPFLELTFLYPDGNKAVLRGVCDPTFIKGILFSDTGEEEAYLLKEESDSP
jgi:hypothetical protein